MPPAWTGTASGILYKAGCKLHALPDPASARTVCGSNGQLPQNPCTIRSRCLRSGPRRGRSPPSACDGHAPAPRHGSSRRISQKRPGRHFPPGECRVLESGGTRVQSQDICHIPLLQSSIIQQPAQLYHHFVPESIPKLITSCNAPAPKKPLAANPVMQ